MVFDTNILHQEGFNSGNMRRLERIAQTGRITVCVPNMVIREFLTHKISDAQEVLGKSKHLFPDLQKRIPGTIAAEQEKKIQAMLEKFELELEKSYMAALEEWKRSLKVEILDFNSESISDVFNDYFGGNGVFRIAKRRDDIPDSVIGYTLLPLLKRGTPINVIVKDGALKKYLVSQGFAVFDGLSEFFASDDFRELSDEIDNATKNVEEIKFYLSSVEAIKMVADYVRADVIGLEQIYVEQSDIEDVEILDMNVYGVKLNGTTPQGVVSVEIDEVSYVGPGYFLLKIVICAYASVSFVASYMDFINLEPPRDKLVEMSSMNGDGWADLTEVRKVQFRGYVGMHFPDTWNANELRPHMHYLAAPNAAVKVELDINSAIIL